MSFESALQGLALLRRCWPMYMIATLVFLLLSLAGLSVSIHDLVHRLSDALWTIANIGLAFVVFTMPPAFVAALPVTVLTVRLAACQATATSWRNGLPGVLTQWPTLFLVLRFLLASLASVAVMFVVILVAGLTVGDLIDTSATVAHLLTGLSLLCIHGAVGALCFALSLKEPVRQMVCRVSGRQPDRARHPAFSPLFWALFLPYVAAHVPLFVLWRLLDEAVQGWLPPDGSGWTGMSVALVMAGFAVLFGAILPLVSFTATIAQAVADSPETLPDP